MKQTWMNRKTKDKKKIAYFNNNGIKPYRIDEKGYYYFNAQDTELLNIAYKALERGKIKI